MVVHGAIVAGVSGPYCDELHSGGQVATWVNHTLPPRIIGLVPSSTGQPVAISDPRLPPFGRSGHRRTACR